VFGFLHGLQDPLGAILQLLTGVVGHFVGTARTDLNGELTRYLFSTVDPASGRPLTANRAVTHINSALALAADVLVGAVVLFTSLRSMLEHSTRAKYTLKVVLPRVLVAVALAHGSLFFAQMAIDLNNALGHVALSLGDGLTTNNLPWSGSMSPIAVHAMQASQDVFQSIFALAVVVALVLLVLAYVVRTALLEVLIVTAPLAALCMVLPDTRIYARHWMRLFLTTVFMQALQLIVLRVATASGFGAGNGVASTLYGLATLWIMLKVPGALHSASELESKAHTAARHVERSVRTMLVPAHHAITHRAAP
jgi:hypothetical protein